MFATDLAKVAATAGFQVTGLSHAQLDVTQINQVRQALEQFKPDVVAYTPGISVDICEAQPEDGYLIHTWGAGSVARQCQRIGAAMVYISTCGLFGDEVKFYSEYDAVELKTSYALSKYHGERAAMEGCERTFVIRPGWLFGGTPEHKRNFVCQRFAEAQREPVLRSATDKFGNPTYTVELAKKLLELMETDEYGLYHVTNQGKASRYEYVKCIIEAFGLSNPVEPVDSSAYPRVAPVPDCEMLANLNLKFLGLEPMSYWEEAIHRYVTTLKGCGFA